ncbi:MAG: GlsB/YeaQ/YmgE family stress response membrane protein [Jannaschia sp.]
MTGLGWIAAIIVGGLAGWVGSMIMKADTGLFLNIILGIVGAVVANFLLGVFRIYAAGGWIPQMIVGIIGACLLIWAARMVRGRA